MLAKTFYLKLSREKQRLSCNLHIGLQGNLSLKIWNLFTIYSPHTSTEGFEKAKLGEESKNIISEISRFKFWK